MAILTTVKKGYLLLKTASGYVKLLPRTLASLVSMNDGSTVETQITNINSNIDELNRKLKSESVLWSGTAIYNGTVSLAESLFEYNYLVFMNGTTAWYMVPVIQGMTIAYAAAGNYVDTTSPPQQHTHSIKVSVNSGTSITFYSGVMVHEFSKSHPGGDGLKITKIVGKL